MPATQHRNRRRGVTLIELLVALSILLIAATITFMTFWNVSRAWRRGMALAKDLDHGDFVIEQLTMALRSTYFPDAGAAPQYGFWLEDNGDGEQAADVISWVKLGRSLVGSDAALVSAPHRVKVFMVEDDKGPALALTAWRPFAQPEDFEPDDLEPTVLSRVVQAVDCRISTNSAEEELEWESEWEDTNRVPNAVEITLYLAPLEEGEPPVEMKRYVEIPVAPLSWNRR